MGYGSTKPSNATVSAQYLVHNYRYEDRTPKSVNNFDIPSWVPSEPEWIRRLYFWSLVETQLTMQPEVSSLASADSSSSPKDVQPAEDLTGEENKKEKKKQKERNDDDKDSCSHRLTHARNVGSRLLNTSTTRGAGMCHFGSFRTLPRSCTAVSAVRSNIGRPTKLTVSA